MTHVVIPYEPRDAFRSYHASDKRFSVTVAHRRAGKTVARINRLIKAAVLCDKLNPRFGYLAPFYIQAKEIAWAYLKHYAGPILSHGGKINESELSITLPHNGAVIRLYGAENAERIRGVYFDGIVVDEAQGISRSVLSAIILPALADREGWLDCSGTPKGWSNLLGELVKLAKQRPNSWFSQTIKASENVTLSSAELKAIKASMPKADFDAKYSGIMTTDELERQHSLMSENEYEQEFECNFDAAITGAIYGKEIARADSQNRIGKVWPLADADVHTAWDLGYDDSTAIWWFQSLKSELRILNYYESSGMDITHYCDVVRQYARDCGYSYGKHYVPHDAANELLAAGGRSIVQQAHGLGVRMTVIPATSQQNSIEAARKTIDRSWFDAENCAAGIEALRNYQFEFDADKKVYRSKPRHDWASHGSDAFEIIGQVWQVPRDAEKAVKPRFLADITFDELVASTPRAEGSRI